MINIALKGAEFFAYHGFYPEEQKLGNHFIVDISVSFKPNDALLDDNINNTVNYEKLYDIACAQMKHTSKLIETVAQSIINEITRLYPELETIMVAIKKLHPPLGCKVGYSCVTLNYQKA